MAAQQDYYVLLFSLAFVYGSQAISSVLSLPCLPSDKALMPKQQIRILPYYLSNLNLLAINGLQLANMLRLANDPRAFFILQQSFCEYGLVLKHRIRLKPIRAVQSMRIHIYSILHSYFFAGIIHYPYKLLGIDLDIPRVIS